jgi:translation initiation factor 1
MPPRDKNSRVVWSSEPEAAKPSASSPAPVGGHPPPHKQTARLSRTRQGRAGKTVILIEGLELSAEAFRDLAHDLRQALGTGGTVRDGVIEIQGDMRDRVADLLVARGYRVKFVGG